MEEYTEYAYKFIKLQFIIPGREEFTLENILFYEESTPNLSEVGRKIFNDYRNSIITDTEDIAEMYFQCIEDKNK